MPCDIEITNQNEDEQANNAYLDKKRKDPEGLMYCFCKYLIDKSYTDAAYYTFKTADEKDKNTHFCRNQAIGTITEKILLYGSSLMIVFINTLICYIFEMISGWEKHHSENGQTIY